MKATLLDAKHVLETLTISFPFAQEVPAGITISAVQRTISVKRGTDAAAANVLLGAAQIQTASHQVLQRVTGGVAGALYVIVMAATLSDGTTVLVRGVELPVVTF